MDDQQGDKIDESATRQDPWAATMFVVDELQKQTKTGKPVCGEFREVQVKT